MNVLRELSSIDLNTVLSQAQNVDQYFSTFFRVINNIVNKVAPISAVSKPKLKSFSKPWITQGIRESIKVKNRLLINGNKEKYVYYRNRLTSLIRLSKIQYYDNLFKKKKKKEKLGLQLILYCITKEGNLKQIKFRLSKIHLLMTKSQLILRNYLTS